MNDDDFSSDTSDDDYMPTDHEVVSEEEDSGEEENLAVQDVEAEGGAVTGKRSKRKIKKPDPSNRKRKGGIRLEEEKEDESKEEDDYQKELADKIAQEAKEKIEEKEKNKADSLWADFMKDVGGPGPKSRPTTSNVAPKKATAVTATSSSAKTTLPATSKPDVSSKITITKEFDFAGETIKVTQEVDANSKEAKQSKKTDEISGRENASPSSSTGVSLGKRPGGLGSVLGKIGKKPKISALEKSKIDWDTFKKKEGIEEELKTFNKGRQGYLERKDFLERADLRQFEIEKSLRLASSSKR